MALTTSQRIVYVAVKDNEYLQMDEKIRQALELFPDCKIISMNTHSLLWGSHVWVLIEAL
jgi:hypothetical protein